MEVEILKFLYNHSEGNYRSTQLLFIDFLEAHKEFMDKQTLILNAIQNCITKGFIKSKNRENPNSLIYITEEGIKQL